MNSQKPSISNVGDTYNNFEVTKSTRIPELQCRLIELVHIPSGAQVMNIANDDPENLFCLSFRTLPDSSNGVAHILEHTVLCGSKKYPVKDPFFSMNRRSLNTFMNALTGSDFTCYPAATQVPKDFYNLLDVYLDAVFHPILNPLSFLQEGHRLEFAVPNDPSSPLEFKGVVFNEMKGAMASSSTRLIETLNRAIFPDLTYGNNSGGEPKEIPSLTYEELFEFHKKYYHPSRCLFFFYGNLPLEDHLDFIAKNILDHVEKVPELPPLPAQKRHEKPVKIKEFFPYRDEKDLSDKCLIGFGWLTCNILEQDTLLALSVLEIVLLDTDASPLKMAFLKSGYCKQVSAFLDTEISEAPFYITLRGCKEGDADHLENLIRDKLQEIVKTGIPLKQVENALHQLEFHRSEITGDHTPFGLTLFMRSALLKQHGANPEDGLMIHSLFDRLNKKIHENPNYLTGLIQKYFLNNTHFVRVVMVPDPELEARELAMEKAALEKIRTSLTSGQEKKIIEEAAALKELQKSDDDEEQDALPKVFLDDVPRSPTDYPLAQEQVGVLQVFHHECFTNEITYLDFSYDLPYLGEEELSYVRIFAMLITQIGVGDRDYAENLEYIQAHTGGVGASLGLNLQAADHTQFKPSFTFRGKALHREADKLFRLIFEMATAAKFDDLNRIKEIILKHYTALESSINTGALRYAINLSASSIDVPSKIANLWYGLDYYHLIKEIAQHFDAKGPLLIEKCKELQGRILCLKNPHLVLSCDLGLYEKAKASGFFGLADLPAKPFIKWNSENIKVAPIFPQGRIISSPIAFTGMVFKTISYIDPDAAALNVAAYLFDNLTLHIRLREEGGAYGGGAVSNPMAGNFYFYTYRDPNIKSSLDAFDEAVQRISHGEFDESDLEEAKIEMIQSLDSPVAPGSRGDLAYGWLREGKTYPLREKYRHSLLNLTREDIIQAVNKHILPNMKTGIPVVFAGKDLLEKENRLLESSGRQPFIIEAI